MHVSEADFAVPLFQHDWRLDMTYVDGFVAAVPTANREMFRAHAQKAAAAFKEHGALHVVE